MLDTLTHDDFASRIGERFVVPAEGGPDIELTLAETSRQPEDWAPDDASRAPFALLFHGPLEPVMPQQSYRLDHPDFDDFVIFLVPIGPEGDAMRYQAIFN